MEYGPGTAYEFPYLANWGSLNNNRTTGYMAWDAMGLEEVQNQLNDAEKYDISAIDILLHFWKSYSIQNGYIFKSHSNRPSTPIKPPGSLFY